MKKLYFSFDLAKYLLLLLLCLLSLFTYGYRPEASADLDPTVVLTHKIIDPNLYPHDPYVQHLSFYPGVFPTLIAYLTKFIPFNVLCFIVYLLLKYLLLLVVYNLAQYIFADRKVSILSCFLLILSPLVNIYSLFGNLPLAESFLTLRTLTGPLALSALYFFIKRKYPTSFIILAVLYYFNITVATFLLIMFIFAAAKNLKSIRGGWLYFIILWIPWFLWYINIPNIGGGPSKLFTPILKMSLSHLYFTSSLDLLKTSVFLAYFSFFFYQGLKKSKASSEIKSFIFAITTMWSFSFVFADFIPIRQIITLQFFHSDIFFIALGLIFAAEYIKKLISTRYLANVSIGILCIIALIEFQQPYLAYSIVIMLLLSVSRYKTAYKIIVIGQLLLCFVNAFLFPLVHPIAIIVNPFLHSTL